MSIPVTVALAAFCGLLLIGVAALFAVSRALFTVGVLGRGLHLWRMAGAGGTYFAQLLLAGALALVAIRAL